MKLYLVAPILPANSDKDAVDARLRACIEPIADLVLKHVSDDPALFGMRHEGESAKPPVEPDAGYGYAQVVRIADGEALRIILLESGDPFSGKWMLIRSLVTCRSVFYGYDRQAFVCLPTDASPIVSPDDGLIVVEECSHLLTETDWLDGLRPF